MRLRMVTDDEFRTLWILDSLTEEFFVKNGETDTRQKLIQIYDIRTMFSTTYKKVFTRLFLWLTLEISLTCLGLDDLADYGEFIFERNFISLMNSAELLMT